MNRNLDRPLCCYRLYKTISEDIGLSERYVTRIVKLLDEMGIVKVQEGKRTRYKNKEDKYGFITAPKIFADYRRYIKDDNGEPMIDKNYNYMTEIQKQLDILETNQRDRTKEILIEE
jgi:DNA-binding transcriptional regulator GbsR (MarR family)